MVRKNFKPRSVTDATGPTPCSGSAIEMTILFAKQWFLQHCSQFLNKFVISTGEVMVLRPT
jgi:hypothetical protein